MFLVNMVVNLGSCIGIMLLGCNCRKLLMLILVFSSKVLSFMLVLRIFLCRVLF